MATLSLSRSPRTELAYVIFAGFSLAARRRPASLMWAVALVMAALTGCSKDNPLGPSDVIDRPGLFSTFVYKCTTSSDTGSAIVTYDTLRVTGVELEIGGKKNVNEMTSANDPQHPVYICYEDNGDLSVSVGDPAKVPAESVAAWVTYPMNSVKETETSFSKAEGSGSYAPATIKCSYIGLSTVTLSGNTMAAGIFSTLQRDANNIVVSRGHFMFPVSLGYFSNTSDYQSRTHVLVSRELVDYQITKFRP